MRTPIPGSHRTTIRLALPTSALLCCAPGWAQEPAAATPPAAPTLPVAQQVAPAAQAAGDKEKQPLAPAGPATPDAPPADPTAPVAPPALQPGVQPGVQPATSTAGAAANPNVVLPPVPLVAPGAAAQKPKETGKPASNPESQPGGVLIPQGPPVSAAMPGTTGAEVQSGREEPGGSFSLDSPEGILYDMERGLAIARSNVTFRYREFVVTGDRGLVDYNSNKATLAGNLTVKVRGQVFAGRSLTFDLDSGQWRLASLETEFPPSFFPPGTVKEPLYLSHGSVIGQDDSLRGEDFRFSSCDRGHYYLISRRLEFYRDESGEPDRIVLRKNALYVLDRKITPLPVYVISLRGGQSRRQPLQATFGQNDIDGYFVRSLYNVRATPRLTDSVLLDAMQKRGMGLGFQRQYSAGAGLLYLYAITSREGGREVNARVDRTYQLAQGYRSNIRFESTQNNSLTGAGISSRSGQVSLFREGDQAQSAAIVRYNASNYGFGTSGSSVFQFDHRQEFGAGLSLETSSAFNQSQSSVGFSAQTLDNTATLSRRGDLFDLYLRAEMHDDLEANTSYQLERLPELTLQSTTDRMALPVLKQYIPGDFTFGLGHFNEPSSGQEKQRADFFYSARPKSYRLLGSGNSKTSLTANGTFEQAFYSDDTARYNYTYFTGLQSKIGKFSSQLNYSRQRTFGFTPFQFDYSTPGEYVDASLSYQVGQKFRLNLTGGHDIQNDYTRDVVARVQWVPSLHFYSSLGTSYAPESGQMGDIYGNFRINTHPGPGEYPFGGQLTLGVRYSPERGNLTRVNTSVDLKVGRRNRLQGYAGYNGYSRKFDFTQVRFARDLHCFNLYATYDSQRKEFRLDLAIKAFPFADSRFGRNQFSEAFNASVGEVQ